MNEEQKLEQLELLISEWLKNSKTKINEIRKHNSRKNVSAKNR